MLLPRTKSLRVILRIAVKRISNNSLWVSNTTIIVFLLTSKRLQGKPPKLSKLKGSPKLYFMDYSCVLIILFNTDLYKPAILLKS